MIARREPRRQNVLAYVLLGALAVVVFGSLHRRVRRPARLVRARCGSTSATRASSTSTSAASGRSCWSSACSSGSSSSAAACARGCARESVGNMPWLFFFAALAIPAFYAVGAARAAGRALHDHRVLALLGGPPVGRGLPRAVHHRDGRLHLRAARRGAREDGAARHLPRHHPLLGRRRDRHDAPPLLLRRRRPSTWRWAPSSPRPR